MADVIKLPRLYVTLDLAPGAPVAFSDDQSHYLRSVLRLSAGDRVRAFNGRDGEYLCAMDELTKKGAHATATEQILPQPPAPPALHLYFAPIKKARMDMLVEKAVELGATALHPVITQNTEIRQINEDRLRAQIAEAAEQCERLDVPALHPAINLSALNTGGAPLYACLERSETAPHLAAAIKPGPAALLIGPEGGFTAEEINFIKALPAVTPVTLGPRTLRAETAAIAALATLQNYLHNI
jgi:16S rRNA (uracil1498-N3)-methyltransferase